MSISQKRNSDIQISNLFKMKKKTIFQYQKLFPKPEKCLKYYNR